METSKVQNILKSISNIRGNDIEEMWLKIVEGNKCIGGVVKIMESKGVPRMI